MIYLIYTYIIYSCWENWGNIIYNKINKNKNRVGSWGLGDFIKSFVENLKN